MIVDISVIPGLLYKNVQRHKQITTIFKTALCQLQKQNSNAKIEIIIQLPNGEEFLRRQYPDPEKPGESKENFCKRVEKEIKNIV